MIGVNLKKDNDDIKKANYCADIEAAVMADEKHNALIDDNESFTFETVLSTDRDLKLLRLTKKYDMLLVCLDRTVQALLVWNLL